MKKYILIIATVFYVVSYCGAQDTTQNIINTQTKNMLEEIRRRNGIDTDTYTASGKNNRVEADGFLANRDVQEPTNVSVSETVEINGNDNVKQKLSVAPAFDSRRTAFATGFDISLGFSSSYYKVTDFFKPVLVVDFDDMSAKLPKKGLDATVAGRSNFFLNIYIKNKYEIGSYTSTEGYEFSNIPKNVIDFVSKGNKLGEKISGKISSSMYSFANTSVFFGMKIDNFKFKIDASYFIPLVYLTYDNMSYEFHNDPETGKTVAKVNADVRIYNNIPYTHPDNSVKKMFKSGGVDLNLSGSYTFSPIANLNFSINAIPFFAARMNNGWRFTINGIVEQDAAISYIQNMLLPNQDSQQLQWIKPSFKMNMKQDTLTEKKVYRPLKLSVSSNIRPLKNDYLIITPNIGCSCYKPLYIDAGIKVESRFLKVLGAYYSLNREDRIWKNCLGLFLDTRAFRLELAVSSISSSFASSFKGTGAEAYLGMVIGW